jgi:hypothetical protein
MTIHFTNMWSYKWSWKKHYDSHRSTQITHQHNLPSGFIHKCSYVYIGQSRELLDTVASNTKKNNLQLALGVRGTRHMMNLGRKGKTRRTERFEATMGLEGGERNNWPVRVQCWNDSAAEGCIWESRIRSVTWTTGRRAGKSTSNILLRARLM